MSEQDKILWLQVKKNQAAAFDTLYHNSISYIIAYGQRFSQDQMLVEETIQEVYVDLWQQRHKITIKSSFKFYLLQSFRRRLLKNLKEKRRTTALTFNAPVLVIPSVEEKWVEREEENLRSAQLKAATKTLSPRQQEALFLKFYQQLPSPDIAAIMGLQVGAVYKLISLGLQRLREQLTIK